MNKLTASAVALSCALAVPTATADTILGIYAGAQLWDMSAEGSFGNSLDQQTTFDFENENQASFYVALEHPVPLIPNARIKHHQIETNGLALIADGSDFRFDDFTYPAGSKLTTNVDLTNTDFVLYYEFLDNVVSFDLGINAKNFEGGFTVMDDQGNMSSETISGWVPMIYGAAEVILPLTGLSLFASGSGITYDGHSIYDYEIGVGYELIDNIAIDVTLQLGYKAAVMELEDLDDVYSDLSFDGAFVGLEAHF